jgi:hypothetical protein
MVSGLSGEMVVGVWGKRPDGQVDVEMLMVGSESCSFEVEFCRDFSTAFWRA